MFYPCDGPNGGRVMKEKREHIESIPTGQPRPRSAIDLWRAAGAGPKSKGGVSAPDSMLAVAHDRATYTLIVDGEVSSIHFDRKRGEIFFRGHNIQHITLTEPQLAALRDMKKVLAGHGKGHALLSDYCATLGRCLTDNDNGGIASKSASEDK